MVFAFTALRVIRLFRMWQRREILRIHSAFVDHLTYLLLKSFILFLFFSCTLFSTLSFHLTLSVVPNSRTQRVGCAGIGTRHDHQLVHSSFSLYFLAFL